MIKKMGLVLLLSVSATYVQAQQCKQNVECEDLVKKISGLDFRQTDKNEGFGTATLTRAGAELTGEIRGCEPEWTEPVTQSIRVKMETTRAYIPYVSQLNVGDSLTFHVENQSGQILQCTCEKEEDNQWSC